MTGKFEFPGIRRRRLLGHPDNRRTRANSKIKSDGGFMSRRDGDVIAHGGGEAGESRRCLIAPRRHALERKTPLPVRDSRCGESRSEGLDFYSSPRYDRAGRVFQDTRNPALRRLRENAGLQREQRNEQNRQARCQTDQGL